MTRDVPYYDLKKAREFFISDLIEHERIAEQDPLFYKIAERIASMMIDQTLTFEHKDIMQIEKEAKIFYKICCNDGPEKTAKGLLTLLDYLKSTNIALTSRDKNFIKNVVITNYLEPAFTPKVEIAKEEEKYSSKKIINSESKEEQEEEKIDTAFKPQEEAQKESIIKQLRDVLETIDEKKIGKSEEEISHSNYSSEEIAALNVQIADLMQKPENLEMLELHIMKIYAKQSVGWNDYKMLIRILNDIQKNLEADEYIVKTYGHPKVENFGSSANSLWSFNSDVDIVIEFENSKNQEQKGKSSGKEKDDKIGELKAFDYTQCLKDIRSCLKRLADKNGFEAIYSARVPILKFKHYFTQIECDI